MLKLWLLMIPLFLALQDCNFPGPSLWPSLNFANVLLQVLDHRLMLEPRRLRRGREPPPVSLLQIQLASLNKKFDAVLWKCQMWKQEIYQLTLNLNMYQVPLCTCDMKCGAVVKVWCGHVDVWVVVVVPGNEGHSTIELNGRIQPIIIYWLSVITSLRPTSRHSAPSRASSWWLVGCSRPGSAVGPPSSGLSIAFFDQTGGSWKS